MLCVIFLPRHTSPPYAGRFTGDIMARSRTTFTKQTSKGGKKGRKRKSTVFTENAELLATKDLMTPLEVLQGFACNPKTVDSLRVTAATAAAKYVHQAMPFAIQLSGEVRTRRTFADAVAEDQTLHHDKEEKK